MLPLLTTCLLCFTLAPTQTDAYVYNRFLEGLLGPWFSVSMSSQTRHPISLPEVKQQTVVAYNGLNYIMVNNVSLGFAEAERYCRDEFSHRMHLASIHSDHEWHAISKAFGMAEPRDIWLGGSIYRFNAYIFVFSWTDQTFFSYDRFPMTEKRKWVSNWPYRTQVCVKGTVQFDGQGNWSTETAPCTEPHPFICKESASPATNAHFQPSRYRANSAWNPLMPRIPRYPPYERIARYQYIPFEVAQKENRPEEPEHLVSEQAEIGTTLPAEESINQAGQNEVSLQPIEKEKSTQAGSKQAQGQPMSGLPTEKEEDSETNTTTIGAPNVLVFNDTDTGNSSTRIQIMTDIEELPRTDANNASMPIAESKFVISSGAPHGSMNAVKTSVAQNQSAVESEGATE